MSPKLDAEQKEERRAQILQAAMTCFAEKGYHLTTMDDIVAASGLSKGSIYWYYKGKQEILRAMMIEMAAQMQEGMAQMVTGAGESAADKLRGIMELSAEMSREWDDLLGLFIDFWSASRSDEEVQQAVREMYEPFFESVVAVIEEGIQRGEFRQVNAADLAAFLMAGGDGLAMQDVIGIEVSWATVADTLMGVLLEGLQPRANG